MNCCLFVLYDRPNQLTDLYETLGDCSVLTRNGLYDIDFLKGQNRISRKKKNFP